MNSVVSLLKHSPSLEAQLLRQMLRAACPTLTNLDSKFLNNFRIRVANYHAKNPDAVAVTMKDSLELASTKNLSVAE